MAPGQCVFIYCEAIYNINLLTIQIVNIKKNPIYRKIILNDVEIDGLNFKDNLYRCCDSNTVTHLY